MNRYRFTSGLYLFSYDSDKHKMRANVVTCEQTDRVNDYICDHWDTDDDARGNSRYFNITSRNERVICICTKITTGHSIFPDAHVNENGHLRCASSSVRSSLVIDGEC